MHRLLVSILLISSLAIFSCSNFQHHERLSAAQWEILSYLPLESQFVLFTNLDALRKSQYWDKFIESTFVLNKNNIWLKDFENNTGVGIKKGISQFYTTVDWSGNNSTIIQFNKNLRRIKNYFNDGAKFKKTFLNNYKIYNFKNNPASNYLFVNDSLLLISNNYNYVSSFTKKENNSLAENQILMGIIERIPYKNYYWMAENKSRYAAELFGKLLKKHTDIPLNKLINSITGVSLCAEFSDILELQSNIICKSFGDAHLIAATLKSGISMDLFSEGNKQLRKILNKLKIESSGSGIKLNISLNERELLDFKKIAVNNEIIKKL